IPSGATNEMWSRTTRSPRDLTTPSTSITGPVCQPHVRCARRCRARRPRGRLAPRQSRSKRGTMPDPPDLKQLQEQIFDLVARSQSAVLDAGRSFTDSVSNMAPGDTSAVDELIDRAFDLTERVLEAQRDFAKQVVQAATNPLTPTGDEEPEDDGDD